MRTSLSKGWVNQSGTHFVGNEIRFKLDILNDWLCWFDGHVITSLDGIDLKINLLRLHWRLFSYFQNTIFSMFSINWLTFEFSSNDLDANHLLEKVFFFHSFTSSQLHSNQNNFSKTDQFDYVFKTIAYSLNSIKKNFALLHPCSWFSEFFHVLRISSLNLLFFFWLFTPRNFVLHRLKKNIKRTCFDDFVYCYL